MISRIRCGLLFIWHLPFVSFVSFWKLRLKCCSSFAHLFIYTFIYFEGNYDFMLTSSGLDLMSFVINFKFVCLFFTFLY